MRNGCWVAVAIAVGLVNAARGDAGSLRRWAVLASPELADLPLVDLLTVALAEDSELELVERQQVAEILDELTVANALGPAAAGERLKLGRLLGADALLLLSRVEHGDEALLRVVISDCVHGARLWVDVRPLEVEGIETLSSELAALVADTRLRYPRGVERVVGVPPFVSRSLTHEWDHLQAELAYVLESGVAAQVGTAALEIEEARAIQRERELTGVTGQPVAAPLFIEGEFRIEGSAAEDWRCAVTIRFVQHGTAVKTTQAEFDALPEVVEFLRSEAIADAFAAISASLGPPMSADVQVDRLLHRSATFERLGIFEQALTLLDAALLISPGNHDAGMRYVELAIHVMEGRPSTKWQYLPKDELLPSWRVRTRSWRQAIGALSQLIIQGSATQFEVLDLHQRLHDAMAIFCHSTQALSARHFRLYEPDQTEWLLSELRRCADAHRDFLRDVAPRIPSLNLGMELVPRHQPMRRPRGEGRSATSAAREWRDLLMIDTQYDQRHCNVRLGYAVRPRRPDDLKRYLHITETVVGEEPIPVRELYDVIAEVCTRTGRTEYLSEADRSGFLAQLTESPRPMSQLAGRFGRVLFDHYVVAADQRTSAEQALRDLREVRGELLKAAGTDGFNLVASVFQRIEKRLAKERGAATESDDNRIARLQAAERALAKSPAEKTPAPVAETGEREVEDWIACDPVQFKVRRRSGEVEMLAPLAWARQPGYIEHAHLPLTFVPAGPKLDVVWNRCALLFHREPGILEEVLLQHELQICNVRWDGSWIWVATATEGVFVFSPAGEIVRRFDAETGLPPGDFGVGLRPLGPGRVVAAGAFGDPARSWCAVLDATGAEPAVDLIHEAAKARPSRQDSDRSGSASSVKFDPGFGSPIVAVRWIRDPLSGGAIIYILERKGFPDHPVFIDAKTRRAWVSQISLGGRRRGGDLYPMKDGAILVLNGDRVSHNAPLDGLLDDGTTTRPLFTAKHADDYLWPLLHGGYLYFPRDTLKRLDPETYEFEQLGRVPHVAANDPFDRWGLSSHLGILVWNEAGACNRLRLPSDEAEPDTPPLAGVRTMRVIGADTDRPLNNALLDVQTDLSRSAMRTDADGLCALGVPPDSDFAWIGAYADGYVARQAVLRRQTRQDVDDGVLTMRLEPVLKIGGVVRDTAGTPVPDAIVHFRVAVVGERRWSEEFAPPVRTDAEGRWTKAFAPLDLSRIRLEFEHENAPRSLALFEEFDAGSLAALRAGRFDAELRCKRELAGIVLGDNGQPLAGVAVRARVRDGMSYRDVDARSDAAGRFTLPTPATEGAIIVQADGYGIHVQDFYENAAREGLRIRLGPGRRFAGRVVDEEDQPAPGAHVYVRRPDASGGTLWEGTTDSAGRFDWPNGPATGKLNFTVEKSGYSFARESKEPMSGERIVLRIQSTTGAALTGSVIDAATRAPLDQFAVELLRSKARHGTPLAFSGGRFEALALPAQHTRVRFSAAGYRPRIVPIEELRANPDAPVEMEPARAPVGHVRAPDGTPVENAVVRLVGPGGSNSLTNGAPTYRNTRKTVTDQDGRFAFAVPDEDSLVYAEHPSGFGEAAADEIAEAGTLALRPWGRLRIRYGLERPSGDLRVELRWARGEAPGPDVRNIGRGGHVVFAGEDEVFAERIPPGEVKVIQHETIRERTGPGSYVGRVRATRVYSVRVEPGETATVDLVPKGPAVRGQVRCEDPELSLDPANLTGVLRRIIPDAEETRDRQSRDVFRAKPHPYGSYQPAFEPDGRFTIPEVIPGEFDLRIRHASGRRVQVRVRVPAGGAAAGDPVVLGEFALEKPKAKNQRAKRRASPQLSWKTAQWTLVGILAVGVGLLAWRRMRP